MTFALAFSSSSLFARFLISRSMFSSCLFNHEMLASMERLATLPAKVSLMSNVSFDTSIPTNWSVQGLWHFMPPFIFWY
jgi:hypothetical protein